MYLLHDPYLFDKVVSQFGNLRVKAHVRLTAAYRRLSRPSSAPDAKAFALCSFKLELYYGISLFRRFSLLVFILELLESRKQLFRLHITSPVKRLSLCFAFYRHFHDEIVFLPSTNKKTFVFSLISIICSFYSFLIRFSMNTISFQSLV